MSFLNTSPIHSAARRTAVSVAVTVIALLAFLALLYSTSIAAAPSPGWRVVTAAYPSAFSTDDQTLGTLRTANHYGLVVSNVGGAPTDGGTVTLTDRLPAGLTIVEAQAPLGKGWECLNNYGERGGEVFTCTYERGPVAANGQLPALTADIDVSPSVPVNSTLTNLVTVSGGGAPAVTVSQPTSVNPSALPQLNDSLSFGVGEFSNVLSNLNGEPDTQAGDHPNGLYTSFELNNVFDPFAERENQTVQDWKDVVVDLPPGLVGNPQVASQCPVSQIYIQSGGGGVPDHSACPLTSQVGTIGLVAHGEYGGGKDNIPLWNVVPEKGLPAEFGFSYAGFPIGLYPSVVGSGADTHIRVSTPGIPASAVLGLDAAYTKFFGDPAAVDGDTDSPNAFFTNSSDCDGKPLVTTIHVDSYEDPGSYNADGTPDFSDPAWKSASFSSAPVSGCAALHFAPSLALQPDTTEVDEPTGLAVDLKVPQNPDAHGLATPPVRDVTVTLPAGVSLSPSAGDGLQACSAAQIDLESDSLGSCPNGSVLGTVTVTTPLLAAPLTGYVFLAAPGCDPCSNEDAADGNMFKLYIQAEGSGVVIKVPGTITVNTTTGQLTSKFLENPQFPFSELQVAFKGGLRAGLATPQTCGTFTGTSDLTPWSAPYTPDATPSSSFDISWDGAGGACPAGGPPLTPSFSAGTSNPNAGQFSPFTLTFAREDRQQDLSGIQVKMPPGLLGTLTGVPLCGEPQAAQGTCPVASRIGTMTVAAGPGGHPFYTQGSIYLTGSYGGAPFGLSIVVPTQAGPFNLGNVVVRSRIDIDENTAALTVTSDPFPQILDGIPLRLRTANVTIERPGFIFNPTNCAQQQITASIAGTQGATAEVSAPFAVSGCAGLHFGPKFTVSTSAHTSKADGASLDAKVVFPAGAQSNIAKVKVELPKQLPSRLTTLQKACPSATFESDPANCPTPSVIGIAKAITPVLPVPLTGPVYFVSHGGEAFPTLVVVLQGYGVRVDLTATTFISKQGITSSTFNTIPDVPVNSFELYLPQGKYSALTTNGNLCTSNLQMPTSFIAQDGAQLKQNTKITVTDCPKKAKQATKKANKATKTSQRHGDRKKP